MKKVIIPLLIICLTLMSVLVYYLTLIKPPLTSIQNFLSYPAYTHEDLTNQAEIIVRGIIGKTTEAKWNNAENRRPGKLTDDDFIYKESFLNVTEVLKGEVAIGADLRIVNYGGQVGYFSMEYHPQPSLQEGKEVIAFLVLDNTLNNSKNNRSNKGKEKRYLPLGAIQGIYEVTGDEVIHLSQTMALNDFIEEIKSFINKP